MQVKATASNRNLSVVCDLCDYRLRMTRTQMVRGLPCCGVCGQRMIPDDFEVAALVLDADELETHFAAELSRRSFSERQSLISTCKRPYRSPLEGADLRSRRWGREDFVRCAEALTQPAAADLPF